MSQGGEVFAIVRAFPGHPIVSNPSLTEGPAEDDDELAPLAAPPDDVYVCVLTNIRICMHKHIQA